MIQERSIDSVYQVIARKFHVTSGKEITDADKAVEYIENSILVIEKGVAAKAVEIKVVAPIGVCGLIKRDTLESHDIGYGFVPEVYGQGFALEAAQAIIEQAKHNADIDHLVAITAL